MHLLQPCAHGSHVARGGGSLAGGRGPGKVIDARTPWPPAGALWAFALRLHVRDQSPSALVRLPFVGGADDLARLKSLLGHAGGGRGGAIFLTGEGGVGKSRLAATMAEEARRLGLTIAAGRAYTVEAGVPYALFSDALLPTLQELGQETLTVLTRGAQAELEVLFPLLRPGVSGPDPAARTADSNLWSCPAFVDG